MARSSTTEAEDLYAALVGQEKARRSVFKAMQWRDPNIKPTTFALELGSFCDARIDAALAGVGTKELVNGPPRHGKTEGIGIATPISGALRAQAMGRDFKVLYTTASAPRAIDVSNHVRAAAERIFQETRDPWWAPGRKWTALEWQTEGGFWWTAFGIDASTGGVGCHLAIMDDLIGKAANYQSRAKRLAIRRAIENDVLSRIMDGGGALHMETRRGVEDTTAWLAEEFGWPHHVWRCYDPDRGYLWPENYGEAWRASMPHLTDSSPTWRALYQQEPVPEGGTLLQADWLQHTYPEDPKLRARSCTRVVLGVDLSLTGQGDPAAVVVIGVQGPFRDLLWAGEMKGDYPAQRQWVREIATEWAARGVHLELAAGGDAMRAELQMVLPGVNGIRPRGSKALRMAPFLPSWASGQIRLPAIPKPWSRRYREVMLSVTGMGDEDDHLFDATSVALQGESDLAMPVAKMGIG